MSSLGWHGSKLVDYCKEVIALPANLLCSFVYGALLGPRSTTGVKAARESRNMSVSDTDTFTAEGAETPTTESEGAYQQIWNDALAKCREILCESDFEAIADCESFKALIERLHDLYEKYSENRWVPRVLRPLEGQLRTMRQLSHALALAMRTSYIKTGIIWGLLNLIIEASLQSERVLTIVVEMIEELTHNLDLLLIYESSPLVVDDMEHALVEVFADVIVFGSYTVVFLRRWSLEKYLTMALWPGDYASKLDEVSERIQKRTRRIKEKVMAKDVQQRSARTRADMVRGMPYALPKDQDREATLPCKHLPLPTNEDFFGRDDILSRLHEELDDFENQQKQKAIAMWGTSGIGKSQIALSYAWTRQSEHLPAVFWVNSESSMEIGQSFTRIACALKLQGAVADGDDDQNWYLVIKWLERTTVGWLLIFDNVEEINIVLDRWPASSHGSILLTSRREIISPGILSLEVPVFTDVQGAEFLMKLVNSTRKIPESPDELSSATELSRLLGGLPLGLTLVATQIRRKQYSISKFLPFYKQHWNRIHQADAGSLKPYYHHSLETAWDISFSQLAEDSQDSNILFGILSVLHSGDIPVDLFRAVGIDEYPPAMKFCADPWSLDAALETLLGTALVRKDPASETLFVHRLIQSAYQSKMKTDEFRQHFKSASKLLYEAFPKLGDKLTLRGHWGDCKKYLQQVIALANTFNEQKFEVEYPNEFSDFAECLSSCTWYLFECGAWVQCYKLVESGLRACDNKDSLLYANLLNTAGIINGCNNKPVEAYKFFERSRDIRARLLPENHEQLANVINNLGNEAVAKCDFEEGLDLYRQAIAIDDANKAEKRFHFRHLNVANAYSLQGKFDEARMEIDVGRKNALGDHLDSFIDNRDYDNMAAWDIAGIYYREGSFVPAKEWYEKFWKSYFEETPLHIVTAAARYKLGCAEMKLGNIDQAITCFREAQLTAEFNEATQPDRGNMARIIRRLAEALEKKGQKEEAAELHAEAEKIRKEMQDIKYSAKDDTEEAYNRLVAEYAYYYR